MLSVKSAEMCLTRCMTYDTIKISIGLRCNQNIIWKEGMDELSEAGV